MKEGTKMMKFKILLFVFGCMLSSQAEADDNCGVSGAQKSRIVGGDDSLPGAWPWIASLQFKNHHVCGATLLNPKWVLTSAFCIRLIKEKNWEHWNVKLGAHNLRVIERGVQMRKLKRMIINPNWKPDDIIGDQVLFELESPVILNKRVNLPCLPKLNVMPKEGKKCVFAGWGKINYLRRYHLTLQEATLPVISKEKCKMFIKEDICVGTGSEPQPSTCHGDLGGPLVCQRDDGRWVLEGVASHFHVYCNDNSGYSPVNKYLTWIQKYINN